MTTTVTDPDTALTGCVARSTSCWAWTLAEWTLDQLQRTILTSTPSPSSWPRYRPKPWRLLIPRRRAAGRAPHHGDWLATSTCTPAGHAGWGSTPPARLRDVLPETATALADGPSPSTMSAIRAAHRTIGDADHLRRHRGGLRPRDHSAKDLRGFLDVLVQNHRPDETTTK